MLLLSFLIFTGYIFFYVALVGMQRSISDSWYALNKERTYITKKGVTKKYRLGWVFSLATWGYVLPLAAYVLTRSTSDWDILLALAASMICFVASAPDFKHADSGWHSFFAEGGIVLILAWMFLSGSWIHGLVTVGLMIPFLAFNVKNNTFWLEVIAYYSLLICVL